MVAEGQTSQLSWKTTNLGILVYGPPRTYKTMFGTTMPDPYYVCTEQGLMTLADCKIDAPFVTFNTYDEAISVVNDLRSGKRAQKRRSLICDDLGSVTDIVTRSIVGDNRGRSLKRNEWPGAVDKLRNFIMAFYDCRRTHHLLLTGRSVIREDLDETGDKQNKRVYGLPATIGQFAFMVMGIFDFVFYSDVKYEWSDQHKMAMPRPFFHTIPTGIFPAGSRVAPGRLPAEIPPNFDNLLELLSKPVATVPRPM